MRDIPTAASFYNECSDWRWFMWKPEILRPMSAGHCSAESWATSTEMLHWKCSSWVTNWQPFWILLVLVVVWFVASHTGLCWVFRVAGIVRLLILAQSSFHIFWEFCCTFLCFISFIVLNPWIWYDPISLLLLLFCLPLFWWSYLRLHHLNWCTGMFSFTSSISRNAKKKCLEHSKKLLW